GAGVVDVRGDRRGAVGRADRTGDVARPLGGAVPVACLACQPGTGEVELIGELLHAEVGLRDGGGREGVGLDDVGTGGEVFLVDAPDHVGLGQHQHVAVALDVLVPVDKSLTAIVGLGRRVPLDHRAHRTV